MSEFWPDDLADGANALNTPITFLKEMASDLMLKTKQVLHCEVASETQGARFIHRFLIIAPSVGNYRYELLSIIHPIVLYPAYVRAWSAGKECADETELRAELKRIASDKRTRHVVTTLLSQSR